MRNPLDPFSKVLDEQSHWDPEWYSWLTDVTTTTTKLEATVASLQSSLAAQVAINASQQSAITALQSAPAPPAPGLVFLQSQLVTSPVASIAFTTNIDATYDAYQFHVTAARSSTNNPALLMQMSLNGGVTWKTTGNVWSWLYSFMSGGATAYGHNSNTEGNNSYFRIGGATSSSWGNSSEVMLYPNRNQNLNSATWRSVDYYDAGSGVYQVVGSGNEVTDATPCNAVAFFFASGNIVSGRISMYGLRKT